MPPIHLDIEDLLGVVRTLDIGHDTAYDLVLDIAQDRLSLAEVVTALGLDPDAR